MKKILLLIFVFIFTAIGLIIIKPHATTGSEIQEFETVEVDERPGKIDRYFAERKMPLEGYGKQFVEAADKYDIDWRLLAAISVIESTGGKHMCKNNPFGWGSCRPGIGKFESIAEAIEYVSKNLGGQNPRTARAYSGGTYDDLMSYNGTVEPKYPSKVMTVMGIIAETHNPPLPHLE